MRLRLILVLAALLVSSCSDDDSLDAFVEVEPEIVIETEALDVDIDALEEAATDTDAEMDEPAPIEIPDDALDLSGMDQVALDIQDNAFTQRVVVVSAGTEITWTNQGRNEHNVRPAVEGAFEPISTLDLAEKGDSEGGERSQAERVPALVARGPPPPLTPMCCRRVLPQRLRCCAMPSKRSRRRSATAILMCCGR